MLVTMRFMSGFLRVLTALVLTTTSAAMLTTALRGTAINAGDRHACASRSSVDVDDSSVGLESAVVGRILVAADVPPDDVFFGTRIILLAHDERGSLGLVVNRPVDVPDAEIALHDGGPVGKDGVILLHDDEAVSGSTPIAGRYFASKDAQVIDEIRAGRGPDRFLLAWGYAGWAPGQLTAELARGTWTVVDAVDAEVLPSARSPR